MRYRSKELARNLPKILWEKPAATGKIGKEKARLPEGAGLLKT